MKSQTYIGNGNGEGSELAKREAGLGGFTQYQDLGLYL